MVAPATGRPSVVTIRPSQASAGATESKQEQQNGEKPQGHECPAIMEAGATYYQPS